MAHFDLSIIICTRNRADELTICLTNLLKQCDDRDEIIVIDNRPSNNKTLYVVENFNVQYFRLNNGGKSTAMNMGIKKSNSEIVAFLDDDDFIERGWRNSILNHFDDPLIAYVSGLRRPFELKTTAQHLFHLKGGFSKGESLRVFNSSQYKNTWWRGVPIYLVGLGGNSAVKKTAIEKVGGFDELFGPGEPIWASESTELCYRLLQTGYSLIYDPTITVQNKYIDDYNVLKKRLFNYGLGDTAIQTKFLIKYGDFRSLSEILFYRTYRQLLRVFQTFFRSSGFPVQLILIEWFGNLIGPWVYLYTKVWKYFEFKLIINKKIRKE